MDYLNQILVGLLSSLGFFFVGWKLRRLVPEKNRFAAGFAIVLAVLTLVMILSLQFQLSLAWRQVSAASTGFSVGFIIGFTQKDKK